MAKLTKEEKAARKLERKKAGKGLWAEFKEFINRGNAFMLAVGVVIGGAFSAIVNAFVNILTSLATWPVPGGLAGLVSPLPAITDVQKGLGAGAHVDIGIGQQFEAGDLMAKAEALATKLYGAGYSDVQFIDAKNMLTSNYTLYGKTYYYNATALINWGTLLNAVIAFIIIAIVLFIIVKVANAAAAKKAAAEAKARERYYEKHPEERPVEPEPGVPEPTEKELLASILAELKKQNEPAKK
ncbi:MAG: MscL family protein [Bacilli bacterium]|nr:MscL family protein [Bacilli bacterium]